MDLMGDATYPFSSLGAPAAIKLGRENGLLANIMLGDDVDRAKRAKVSFCSTTVVHNNRKKTGGTVRLTRWLDLLQMSPK